MKFKSRPLVSPMGTGAYTLKLEYEELQLISAFLDITRLGAGRYQRAAMKLMTAIDEEFGSDFGSESSDEVDLCVSRMDADGDTILDQFHFSEVTLEV